jgi:methyl-accepting chemotaxis protein
MSFWNRKTKSAEQFEAPSQDSLMGETNSASGAVSTEQLLSALNPAP